MPDQLDTSHAFAHARPHFTERMQRELAYVRDEVLSLRERADNCVRRTLETDQPISKDAELISMTNRFHAAFCMEHARALDLIETAHRNMQERPESSHPLYVLSKSLRTEGSKPLARMEILLSAMNEIPVISYYEDDTL